LYKISFEIHTFPVSNFPCEQKPMQLSDFIADSHLLDGKNPESFELKTSEVWKKDLI